MTRDDIIRMAREAGWQYAEDDNSGYEPLWKAMRLAYAAGAAAEREECAMLCEDEAEKWEGDDGPISTEARLCAFHIRARGTND